MQNSQNIVLSQRWESSTVCCVAPSEDAAARALQRGAAIRIWEPRGKRGDEEESSNDGIKEI